jgi:segregation and condensation protein A
MSLPALWHSSLNYKISTEVYEGPLDLLLHLIEQAELDITKLSLAKVTDQYLAHLQTLTDRDPVEVSAFLVIAAKLVFIKSSILLPSNRDVESEEEEDLGDQLARQLLEYKKFKDVALWMKEREQSRLQCYYRVGAPPKYREVLDVSDLKAEDLVDILLGIYFENENFTPLSDVVTITTLTIKNKIKDIINQFRQASHSDFSTILGEKPSRLDLIVTFLALLELIKHHTIEASQESLFGDIALDCVGNLDEEFETEL